MYATGPAQQPSDGYALPSTAYLELGYQCPEEVSHEPLISAELYDAMLELATLLESSETDG